MGDHSPPRCLRSPEIIQVSIRPNTRPSSVLGEPVSNLDGPFFLGNSGDIYEQAVVKTVAGFFRGKSKHLFGVTRLRVLALGQSRRVFHAHGPEFLFCSPMRGKGSGF